MTLEYATVAQGYLSTQITGTPIAIEANYQYARWLKLCIDCSGRRRLAAAYQQAVKTELEQSYHIPQLLMCQQMHHLSLAH